MIDLTDPRPELIFMEDIAAGLAHQERFTGHCPLRPTIAQHSLAVEHIAQELWAATVATRTAPFNLSRAALMHDAAEFLVGDCTGAVKKLMRSAEADNPYDMRSPEKAAVEGFVSPFDELETRAERAIVARFGCAPDGWEEIIHEADYIACAYEMAYGGWCADAVPPEWLKHDLYLKRCYRPPMTGAVGEQHDGGEAAFLRRARALGMVNLDLSKEITHWEPGL